MTVDCNELTADCHFGHPNYLSAEEMRDLLTGFRGRAFSSSAICREDPDPSGDSPEETSGIQPISSTEFSPGTKRKTTVKSRDGGSIVLDSNKVGSGKKVEVHNLKFTPSGASEPTTVKVLAEKDMEIPPGGAGKDQESEDDSNVTFEERNDKLYVGVYYT